MIFNKYTLHICVLVLREYGLKCIEVLHQPEFNLYSQHLITAQQDGEIIEMNFVVTSECHHQEYSGQRWSRSWRIFEFKLHKSNIPN